MSWERGYFYADTTQAMTNATSATVVLVAAPGAGSRIRVLAVWSSLTRASPAGANGSCSFNGPISGVLHDAELIRDGDTHDVFVFPDPGIWLLENEALRCGGVLNVAGPSTGRFGAYCTIDPIS